MIFTKEILNKFEMLAFDNIAKCDTNENLSKYLMIWWCHYYKRPKKDPMLLEYTIEELLLEFFEQMLMNDKARYHEIKNKVVEKIKVMTDEEWIKLQEQEVGSITEAYNIEIPEEVSDKFGE